MKGKKLLAWILLLAVAGALAAPAALAQEETVHISTLEDLQKLARLCAVDSYSRGLRVILDQDLDLGGEEIYPIPSFSGIFEGGGHSLTGLFFSLVPFLLQSPFLRMPRLMLRIRMQARIETVDKAATIRNGCSRTRCSTEKNCFSEVCSSSSS